MPLATSKYHVTLNAAGYTLHPQSYKLKAQPPFTPRFATGDPSLGDLSFWQFFSQEDFSGGEGQDFFNNKTKFRKSFALDMRDGKPRQPFPATQLTLDTAIPNLGTAGWQHKFKFVPFGGDLVLVGPSASDTLGTMTLIEAAASEPRIYHTNAWDAVVWNRDGNIGGINQVLAVAYHDGSNYGIKFFDDDYNIDYTYTVAGVSARYVILIPISPNAILMVGYDTSDNLLLLSRVQWDPGTWNNPVVSQFDQPMRSLQAINGSYAIDSVGTIHFAVMNPTRATALDHSIVFRITAADAALVNPRVSAFDIIAKFVIHNIFDINGTVYLAGADTNALDGGRTHHPTILKFPNIIVYQQQNDGTIHDDCSIRPGVFPTRQGVVFAHQNLDNASPSGGGGTHVYRALSIKKLSPGDVVQPVGVLFFTNAYPGPAPGIAAISDFGGRIYIYNRLDSAILRLGSARGTISEGAGGGGGGGGGFAAPGAFVATGFIQTSEMGANTPLIQKTLHSLIVELSVALPTSEAITFYINDDAQTYVMAPADGTKKIFTPTVEHSDVSFIITAKVGLTYEWNGYIKRITVKYLPTQYKKYAWALGLRLEKHQKLLDGQPETDTPITKIAALKTAWQSNVPITYVDVDGTSYTVIVTDFQVQRPVIANDRDRLEAIAFVELLEV